MSNDSAHKTRYRVIYGDVDQMGVVYYGNYLRLFEWGRTEMIRDRGLAYKEIEDRGVALPVTEAYCHYHKSAMYDDLLVIETRIGFVKRASLRFDYRIFRDETETVPLVDGYTVHAFVDPTGRIVRMPGFVKNALSGAVQGE